MTRQHLTLAAIFIFSTMVLFSPAHAQGGAVPTLPDARIVVDARLIANSITPWMTGSCIEDVNHEIYGGLYDQKLFGESFEEPPASATFEGWIAYGGSWRVDGNVCSVNSNAGAKLVRGAPVFVDGTVEAEMKFPPNPGQNAELLVRVQNPGMGIDNFDGYEISLLPSPQRISLARHRHNFVPLKDAPAPVQRSGWNHLRVVLDGARIRTYLNNAADPAIDYTDPQAINTLNSPKTAHPEVNIIPVEGVNFSYTFPADSYTVLRMDR